MVITYHFLAKMKEKGFGRIVNTTSGIRREPEQAGYSGRCFGATNFHGMSLEEAVKYAEENVPGYLGSLD